MDKEHEQAIEQDEQHNMELWRAEVNTNLREITKTLAEVNALTGKLPTRAEIETMLSQRVHIDVFRSEIQSIREDIAGLRNAPAAVRGWSNTAIAAVGCIATTVMALISSASMVVSIIAITRPH